MGSKHFVEYVDAYGKRSLARISEIILVAESANETTMAIIQLRGMGAEHTKTDYDELTRQIAEYYEVYAGENI